MNHLSQTDNHALNSSEPLSLRMQNNANPSPPMTPQTMSPSPLGLARQPPPPLPPHRVHTDPFPLDKPHSDIESDRQQELYGNNLEPAASQSATSLHALQSPPPSGGRRHIPFHRHTIGGFVPSPRSLNLGDRRALIQTGSPYEMPLAHYVLLPIGKTGDGKSSLLNLMFGYPEFKAKKSVRSITSKVTERTFVWTFDNSSCLITAADTPGFADSAGRDDEFHAAIKEYIKDVGSRLGIDAFLLVFRYNSKFVMNILQKFVDMMSDLTPGWWDHVILVFTSVDYSRVPKPEIAACKWRLVNEVTREIQEKYNLKRPPKMVFTSAKTPSCALQGDNADGVCDCKPALHHRNAQLRALKLALADKAKEGRWIYLPPSD